ncbi:MAG: carboxypeptidase-like regulatory domain-containing protein, partial [Rhodothermales bacterium]
MRTSALHLTITFLLFRLSFVTDVTAQVYTISGHVVDAETDAALPGVNVFISNTTLGDASGTDGSFRVASVPGGQVEIVASMIG